MDDEGEDESEASKEDEIEEEEAAEMELSYHPDIPIIMPRKRFFGARNVDTVKDGEITSN
jgi:WD repeat-containing protein 42A